MYFLRALNLGVIPEREKAHCMVEFCFPNMYQILLHTLSIFKTPYLSYVLFCEKIGVFFSSFTPFLSSFFAASLSHAWLVLHFIGDRETHTSDCEAFQASYCFFCCWWSVSGWGG